VNGSAAAAKSKAATRRCEGDCCFISGGERLRRTVGLGSSQRARWAVARRRRSETWIKSSAGDDAS
jgi:hypothetical protein